MISAPLLTTRRASTLAATCVLLAACGGSGSGSSAANTSVARQIGPTGGVIEGHAGTPLQGLRIVVPKDALASFVDVTLVAADPIELNGHDAVSSAFELRFEPDPGRLREDLTLRVAVSPPPFRPGDDLVLLRAESVRDWQDQQVATVVSAARTTLGLDEDRRYFTAVSRRAGRFQVQLTAKPRALTDAIALMAKGVAELASFDRRSLETAVEFFRQALLADPHQDEARFFGALARLALVLDDRSDTGPGIDSLGELVEAYGVRLGSKGVLERLLAADWPPLPALATSAPDQNAVLDFYGRVLRPELLATRDELLRVGDAFASTLTPPDFYRTGDPGQRELDFGDLALARSATEALLFGFDYLLAYDWSASPQRFAELERLSELHALPPSVGLLRTDQLARAAAHLDRCLGHYLEGHRAIALETDDQRNDFLVFRRSQGPNERAELFEWVQSVRSDLRSAATRGLRIPRQDGQLFVRLQTAFTSGGIAWRSLLPVFDGWAPLGTSLPDPTAGGLFPGLGRDEAIQRASLPTRAVTASATITIDGQFQDWPAAAAVLAPADPIADAAGYGTLAAIDGQQLHVAVDGDFVYFRLDLADAAFATRTEQATVYEICGAEHGESRSGTPWFSLRVRYDGTSPEAEFRQEGRAPFAVPFATGGRSLECAVPRARLAGELIERRVRFRIRALHLGSAERGADDSRDVILRF